MRRRGKVRASTQGPPAREDFDGTKFLSEEGEGKTREIYAKGRIVFAQGDSANSIFYVQKGNINLSTVSKVGQVATIEVLGPGDLLGEGCLAGQKRRVATATTLSECSLTELARDTVVRMIKSEPDFSKWLISYLIRRRIRIEKVFLELL
jgi:CRP/FNR family cyclic AMP-dependent transcriptional regulator